MENPSIVSHISLGVADLERAAAFYDAVLAVVGARRMVEHPGAIGYGKVFPEFWIGLPFDGAAPGVGNGTHVGFLARGKEEVDAFWQAALAQGGTGDGAPGLRPMYSPDYYGCFVRDPDGHKIEAQALLEQAPEDPEAVEETEAHPT
jgi:catechol 2,3-dioxygenase-like lactoylglutathione lyase family enzyme